MNDARQRRYFRLTVNRWPTPPMGVAAYSGGDGYPIPPTFTRVASMCFVEHMRNRFRVRYAIVQGEQNGDHDGSPFKGDDTKEGWLCRGPAAGVHLQCYMEFNRSVRVRTVRQYLRDTGWNASVDSVEDGESISHARDYCTLSKADLPDKVDTIISMPFEHGAFIRPDEGETSSDYERAVSMVIDGASLRHTARTYPLVWVRHHRGLRSLRDTLHGNNSSDGMEIVNPDEMTPTGPAPAVHGFRVKGDGYIDEWGHYRW